MATSWTEEEAEEDAPDHAAEEAGLSFEIRNAFCQLYPENIKKN